MTITVPEIEGADGSKTEAKTLHITVGKFAAGGFPEDGLFFANHNEIIGKFDDGRNVVANNEQIITGISDGVYRAMRESNELLQGIITSIDNKDTSVVIGDRQIAEASNRGNSLLGRTIVT